MTVSLDRFCELREKYNKIVPLAERKSVEISGDLFGHLDADNLDLLARRYEVYGAEKEKTFKDLLTEYDLRRGDIENGLSTGDLAVDIVFSYFGLSSIYSSTVEKTQRLLQRIQDSSYLMILNYWEKLSVDDVLFNDQDLGLHLGHLHGSKVRILPHSAIAKYRILDQIDPDEKRPSSVLCFTTVASYAEGRLLPKIGSSESGRKIWESENKEMYMDPRVLPHISFGGLEVKAVMDPGVIPRYRAAFEVEPDSLVKVEIIMDEKRIRQALAMYTGVASKPHSLLYPGRVRVGQFNTSFLR